jgi:hypothetical protein
MTASELGNGAARVVGWIERVAQLLIIAAVLWLFATATDLQGRMVAVETIQGQGPAGREVIERLSTLEAEMRELRRSIDRAFGSPPQGR